jgi:hypothetical protein
MFESGPPASNNNTEFLGFLDKRLASKQPAEPAPIIM